MIRLFSVAVARALYAVSSRVNASFNVNCTMNSFWQCNEYKVAADDADRFAYTMLILDKRREPYPNDLMRFWKSCISTPQKKRILNTNALLLLETTQLFFRSPCYLGVKYNFDGPLWVGFTHSIVTEHYRPIADDRLI